MSKENVRLFYSALAEDKVLQEKFKVINTRVAEKYKGKLLDKKLMDESFQRELLPVAKEAGFEFSLDELNAYATEAKEAGELADSELAAVAGGAYYCLGHGNYK